jgi:hypothetical protein|tara:strand:+ start:1245 stop:1463 length:219 start_codon:yes stop_codon:yes gene_type:complete
VDPNSGGIQSICPVFQNLLSLAEVSKEEISIGLVVGYTVTTPPEFAGIVPGMSPDCAHTLSPLRSSGLGTPS